MPGHQGYDPILQSNPMDTSVDSVAALPSTHSSQQLMPSDNADSTSDGIRRPSRGFRSIAARDWFTVAVLCFVNLINYMDRFTIAGVLTDIQDNFSIGDDEGGLLQTAFVLSYMVCAPLFGYLGDRYSRRWIMAIGVCLWSATTVIGSFMNHFGWFITFRALVGVGEASYSTIAPTLISDLFVHDMRSKMLALFYFAIPVGSGFGYIIGSETALLAGSWRWALRVTPFLGVIAVILILLIREPERGQSEGSHNLATTTYTEDLKDLCKNRSFMLSTGGFTCVAFVAGALAWWGPKFIHLGLRMQPGNENVTLNDVSYKFGIIAMVSGLIGVPLGSYLAQKLRPHFETCDPIICAWGLFVSSPLVFFALVVSQHSTAWCFLLVFLAELAINLCWSIVADILLYVVIPTRRSTAEAFQILISHAFGDAGSPYMVGVISEAIKAVLRITIHTTNDIVGNGIESLALTQVNSTRPLIFEEDTNQVKFQALQYALFSTSFVEVIGGVFFLITAVYILRDKEKATLAVRGYQQELSESSTPSISTINLNRDSQDAVPNHTFADINEPS